MFVQEAEPGPPKSRNEKSSYPGAAGTQRRPGDQAKPGAEDLTHHRVGWAAPLQKELEPVKKSQQQSQRAIKQLHGGSCEMGGQGGTGIDSCSTGDQV